MNTPTVYVLCDANCKWESMTKEQILTAIMQAVTEGNIGDIDAGFITKIQEMNAKGVLQFWVGTTAEYNALATTDEDTLYILTDEETGAALLALKKQVDEIEDGTRVVERATHAESADKADEAYQAEYAYKSSVSHTVMVLENAEDEDERDLPITVNAGGVGMDEGCGIRSHDTLTYNPNTQTLKVRYVDGAAREAIDATNAVYASSVKIAELGGGSFPVALLHTYSKYPMYNDDLNYDADTKTLTVKNLNGTAAAAVEVVGTEGIVESDRHVWFSDNAKEEKRAYAENFKYNPVTGTLTVTRVDGVAAHATDAASATRATEDEKGNNIVETYATKDECAKVVVGTATVTNNNMLYTMGNVPTGKTIEDITAVAFEGEYAQLHGVRSTEVNTNNQLLIDCVGMVYEETGLKLEGAALYLIIEDGKVKISWRNKYYQTINNGTPNAFSKYSESLKKFYIYFK